MKREILLVLLMCSGLLAGGCQSHRVVVRERTIVAPDHEVIVETAPPAPRREMMGVAPTSSHVWVEGFWTSRHGRWVWIPGHWEVRPRVGAHWEPGHWDHTQRGWVWTPGHWE